MGKDEYSGSLDGMIEGRILPWVQDISADGYPVWSDFGANQRDVFFLDYDGMIDTSFNSTPYNPSDPDDVLYVTNLIVSMREDDPVTYTGPVWHVDDAGSNENGDGSESNPFATIQLGIESAVEGDTVLIEPGTYFTSNSIYNKNIILGSRYLMTADTSYISTTIIDGTGEGCPLMIYGNDVTNACRVTGLTIQNGTTGCVYGQGGGLYVEGTDPRLDNLIIKNNHSTNYGGGICIKFDSSPLLDDIIIKNNTADELGGGIYVDYNASPVLNNIEIVNNSAFHGGGIFVSQNSHVIINNTLIAQNYEMLDIPDYPIYTTEGYGAIETTGSTISLNNCTITDNLGVGMLLKNGSQVTMINSIYWFNESITMTDSSDQETNILSVSYSDIQFGWDGEGNIDMNPRFCSPDDVNYYLSANSPVVGVGENGTNMGAFGIGCNISVDWDFSIGEPIITIEGIDGDWNPGESISIEMDFCNNSDIGHMFYPGVILESDTNLVSISNSHYWFYGMDPNTCNTVNFFVVADSSISSSTILTFSAFAEALNCENQPEYCIVADTVNFDISILVENTEMSINEHIPLAFKVYNAYPNPFNPITSIDYDLPEDGFINITIYSMMGNIVKTLVNGPQTAGNKTIQWNATNDRNEPVSAGLYLYTIQTGEFRQTKKMILLK